VTTDATRTQLVLDQLKDAFDPDRPRAALSLLRHADAGAALPTDPSLADAIAETLGPARARKLTAALALDPCPYCRQGREPCDDCAGSGSVADRVCTPCAGLGLRRCPFCNGTSLAGYDFVPRGLRLAVARHRLDLAAQQTAALRKPPADARALAQGVLAADRARGIAANAAELAHVQSPSRGGAFTAPQAAQLQRDALAAHLPAEAALRDHLRRLGSVYARRAADAPAHKRDLYRRRATHFAALADSPDFAGTALATPRAIARA
jgi:hypothetical protein